MKGYRKGSHTVYRLHFHLVFIPKYRKPVLRGEVGKRLRELIIGICNSKDIEIISGHIRPDHVHMLISALPSLAPSRIVQAIKGKTSHQLLQDFRTLRKEFWGRHFCGSGYFIATSGNVTDEVLADYIKNQDVEPQNEEVFKVTE
ncbi:IS200/IS605 family transposase [Candidatus Fermentibacteria bacterium]|nr:MAG: IS200/IS605 family transposase [Candidatus Fermentibacteria bacterium]